jgi:hypothetical protein
MNGSIMEQQIQRSPRKSSNFFSPNPTSLDIINYDEKGKLRSAKTFFRLSRQRVSQFLPSLHHRKQSKINKQAERDGGKEKKVP